MGFKCAGCLVLVVLSIWSCVNPDSTVPAEGCGPIAHSVKKEKKVNRARDQKKLQFTLLPTRSTTILLLYSLCIQWEWLASRDALLIDFKGASGKSNIFIHSPSQALGTTSCLPLYSPQLDSAISESRQLANQGFGLSQ